MAPAEATADGYSPAMEWGVIASHAMAALLVYGMLFFVAPTCEAWYRIVDAALPAGAQLVLLASSAAVSYSWFLVPLAIVVPVLGVKLVGHLTRYDAWTLSVYSHVVLVLAAATLLAMAWGLSLPLHDWIIENGSQALSPGP